jgi:flagellar protein FlgJ
MNKAMAATEQMHSNSYYDISQLDKLRSAKPDDQEALKAAARQFESIFTQMLLTSMRKASEVLESDSPFNSQSTKFYQDMQDKQMISDMASKGGLGLADLIYKQLSGTDANYTPSSIGRADGQLNGLGRIHASSNTNSHNTNHEQQKVDNKTVKQTDQQTNERKSSLFDDPTSFIESLLPTAKKVLENSPLQPAMLLAQAALETGWGKKVINKTDGGSSHNLFGIKADSRWQGEKASVQTLEFKDGVAKKHNALFRAYESVEESIKDYVKFLSSNDRYSQALQNADNPKKYFESLQSAGYATDPDYANKIMKIMDSGIFAGMNK